jgi:hypothetical protein
MKTNESVVDRVIRVIVGIALLVLYFTHVVTGGIGIVSIIVGALLLLTGAVGFCPLYSILKFRTNKL